MKLVLPLLCLLFIGPAYSFLLKSGDVILLPLNCYLCSAIETQTGSEFSHSGIFMMTPEGPFVLEALGKVKRVPLEDFLKRADKEREVAIYRARELKREFHTLEDVFEENYEGADFDRQFLWDNKDDERELFYCSEFVAKLLNHFLKEPIRPKPMRFDANRDYWLRFFNGRIPDGELGNSPQDFTLYPQFYQIK